MQRREDWAERLLAVVDLHRRLPFEWGVSDCAMMFRHCVAAMTGSDPLCDLAPWYSARTAVLSLRRAGYDSAVDLVRARFTEIAPADAGRGDVGFLAERDSISAPAIVLGAEAVSRNERSFVIVPAASIEIAFRI